ncbi:hypothetical protein N7513_003502 [Penicillium frequentans]|nr:hypothetical protein N7513_003502 [Penicillium glabrum]
MVVTAENLSDDKGPKVLAVVWTLTSLTLLMVVARVFIRLKMLKNFGFDDYLIVVAMALGLAYCGATTASVYYGFGKHTIVVEEHGNLVMAMLLNNCDPPRALWTPSLQQSGQATCKSTWMLIDFAIFTGTISASVDLYLACYPMTVLMKLQMSLRKRLALSAALGLGAIAAAMAIVKCTQLHGLADKSDYTYGTADLILWTNIEANVVAIASCIPTLQPLLEIILGKRTLGSYSNSNGQSGYRNRSSNWNTASYDRSKRSAVRDDLAITNVESQESILHSDGGKDNHVQENVNEIQMSPIEIRRTDNFTVNYETRPQAGGDTHGSW